MPTLSFRPAGDDQDPEDHDDGSCQCQPADSAYLLEIEEGQAVLIHATCGRPPSSTWGDWQEFVTMNPIPVNVEWDTDCDGSPWHGMDPCDCDHWVQVTATSVPENVRTEALELSRKHAENARQTAAQES